MTYFENAGGRLNEVELMMVPNQWLSDCRRLDELQLASIWMYGQLDEWVSRLMEWFAMKQIAPMWCTIACAKWKFHLPTGVNHENLVQFYSVARWVFLIIVCSSRFNISLHWKRTTTTDTTFSALSSSSCYSTKRPSSVYWNNFPLAFGFNFSIHSRRFSLIATFDSIWASTSFGYYSYLLENRWIESITICLFTCFKTGLCSVLNIFNPICR